MMCPIGHYLKNSIDKTNCEVCPEYQSSIPSQNDKCSGCKELLSESVLQKSVDFWGNKQEYLSYSGYVAHKICLNKPDILYKKDKEDEQ